MRLNDPLPLLILAARPQDGSPVSGVEAPYPSEHAARLREPSEFKTKPDWADQGQFRRTEGGTLFGRVEVPQTISIIWGQLKDQSGEEAAAQALRFPVADWTADKAKAWLQDHEVEFKSFEPAADTKAELVMPISFEAAEASTTVSKSGRSVAVTILAYTGGMMRPAGWPCPIVVELSGMEMPGQVPLLSDHDAKLDSILGHGQPQLRAGQLLVLGRIHAAGKASQRVIGLSKNGFRFQASIGAQPVKGRRVQAGDTVTANNQTFTAPEGGLILVTRSRLKEVSILSLGADVDTEVTIAARAASQPEEATMKFNEWLKAKGFDPDKLTEESKKFLQAAYDAEIRAQAEAEKNQGKEPEKQISAGTHGGTQPPKSDELTPAELVKQMRAESSRIHLIEAMKAETFPGIEAEKFAEIKAKSISDGWTPDACELELVRASRGKGPAIHMGFSGGDATPQVLEAALCLTAGMKEDGLLKAYGEQTMNTADKHFRHISIQGVMLECCRLAGVTVPRVFGNEAIRAAFTTTGLSGILGATANKALLNAYGVVPSVARRIFGKGTVKDFKAYTRYRLVAGAKFSKVGPDGLLAHGDLGEDTYSQQIDTFGEIIALTRKMILNDDLQAFLKIPSVLGREAALAIEKAAFTLLLANTGNFFHANNKNYASGSTTALSITSLGTAEQMFLDQTDSKGNPISVMPTTLLVPTALKVTGDQIYTSTKLNELTEANKPKPSDNPYAGKYKVECSPWLSNSNLTGYSSKAWYLLGDPADVAAIEIAYLNGVETPTIETGNVDFNQLGIYYRAYHDFGVAQQDPRGAVKMKGEA